MMETARKGMWKASPEQLEAIAELHTELIDKYKPSCSGFVCDNAKLRDFIASKTSVETARRYEQNIREIREASLNSDKGTVLKRQDLSNNDNMTTLVSNTVVIILIVVAVVVFVIVVRRRRKKMEE